MGKSRILLFSVLTSLLLAGTVSATLPASGENWTLDNSGTLVITGTIDADKFEENGWTPYKEQIKTVRLTADAGWMPEYVFDGCTNMTEFLVDADCTAYFADDGVLYQNLASDSRQLICYPDAKSDKEYTVLEHSSIVDRAFADAAYLEKVVFPEDLYYVGASWDAAVFENCASLTEVTMNRTHGLYCPEGTFDGTALPTEVIDKFCWNNPFTDIYPQSPYYDAVKFVEENGLMNGMGNGTFAPDTGMTRGMFVTILGRMAGVTKYYHGVDLFRDVSEEKYYSDYVYWADAEGIAKGYSDEQFRTFGVNDKVTIEQAVVMLARYADVEDVPANDMGSDYDDASDVSDWAKPAMSWATAAGIYDGYGRELRPKANAPRARVAEMLYNYVEKYIPMSLTGRLNANLDGFSYDTLGQNYVTYPGGNRVAVEEEYIVLFVNGSPVECDGICLDDVPIVPVKTVYNALGRSYVGNEKMCADELAKKLGAEYHWCDSSAKDCPYLYRNGNHLTIDLYETVGLVKSKEAAVEHLRETLITAYETRYGVDYVPLEQEVPSTDEQNWHRYKLSTMSVDDVDFQIGRYYKISYVWDFYVDMYTDDVYMMYNGITNRITKFDPRSPGAFEFAG